jgi:hypothetical protein
VAWNHGGVVYGPLRYEERTPVNSALQHLGLVKQGVVDEMASGRRGKGQSQDYGFDRRHPRAIA